MARRDGGAGRLFYNTQKPPPADCLLLSTHEPCPMCAAAIAWSGISEVYFLFDYDDTEKTFVIPHDKNILAQLFPPAKNWRMTTLSFASAICATWLSANPRCCKNNRLGGRIRPLIRALSIPKRKHRHSAEIMARAIMPPCIRVI